mmetsp:Transcript_43665/g.102685  ORF Transcript_43665/g.102685 Transcript_43665/m.102685 type:complete len:257 (-) Transcript_43665:26-796(-)
MPSIGTVRAVVTGAASGLGRSFTHLLAREGAHVFAVDLNRQGLEETVSGLPNVSFGVGDVSDEASVESLFQQAKQAMGGCNVLINNAGIFRDALLVKKDKQTGGSIKNMSLQNWDAVLKVCLTGPFLCAREFSAMRADGPTSPDDEGVIVNISSISRHGNQGQSNYSAAKAGLVSTTKLWAEELARYNVRVGAVAPGFVATPILEGMRPEVLQGMVNQVPLRRLGAPEDIYQGVKFIIECKYFTGRCVDIDGGLRL